MTSRNTKAGGAENTGRPHIKRQVGEFCLYASSCVNVAVIVRDDPEHGPIVRQPDGTEVPLWALENPELIAILLRQPEHIPSLPSQHPDEYIWVWLEEKRSAFAATLGTLCGGRS